MEWTDDAIVLSARPHGETSAIAMALTRDHGRHAGLLRGVRTRGRAAEIEPGTHVRATWRGRLAEHLGHFHFEVGRSPAAALLDDPARLAALASACAVTAAATPERAPMPALYEALAVLLDTLVDSPWWAESYVRWELGLLAALGFGLSLDRCALTGTAHDLAYVSPRTGRAVDRAAAAEWRDRLLPLPGFLVGSGTATPADVDDGLRLTGHFLTRHLFAATHSPPPPARDRLVDLLGRRGEETDTRGTSGP